MMPKRSIASYSVLEHDAKNSQWEYDIVHHKRGPALIRKNVQWLEGDWVGATSTSLAEAAAKCARHSLSSLGSHSVCVEPPRCNREKNEKSWKIGLPSKHRWSLLWNRIRPGKKHGNTKRKKRDFNNVRLEQIITQHNGPIWRMKFNSSGRYLATGGSDAIVRVWTVVGSSVERRRRRKVRKVLNVHPSSSIWSDSIPVWDKKDNTPSRGRLPHGSIINPSPYREYRGHKKDIIDLDWAPKTDFILSSSFDWMVMIWHPSREQCLAHFQHPDSVTSVHFHPESQYFVSGGYDCKVRLWSILDQRIITDQQVESIVTAVAFSPDGKSIAAGLYDGNCIFYDVDYNHWPWKLHKFHVFECRNGRKAGKKVTAIKYLTADEGSNECIISTNDSRIRLLTIENHKARVTTKWKGHTNKESQIGASLSSDNKYVICGSEDGMIYIWKKWFSHSSRFPWRKSKHNKISPHEVIRSRKSRRMKMTVAIFAPQDVITLVEREWKAYSSMQSANISYIILGADQKGRLNVFVDYDSKLPPV